MKRGTLLCQQSYVSSVCFLKNTEQHNMSSNKVSDKGLVVFGAGLPRTGTNSLQVALERLLGGPCYHMKSVFFSKGSRDSDFWSRAIRHNVNDEVSVEK